MGRKPLDLSTGVKRCPKCEAVKPLSEFHRSTQTGHGYQVYCKACCTTRHAAWRRDNLEYVAQKAKEWRDTNPDRTHDYHVRQHYGAEYGTYEKMYTAQQGRCAICSSASPGSRTKRFHVDHCHSSGRIRGLLCHGCNVSLGHFQHSCAVLEAAIRYLSAEGG